MKKIHFTVLTVLSSIFFSAGAIAQNQPLACQSDERAGLSWENGRWKVAAFIPLRFILVKTNDGLTNDSVGKIFESSADHVLCRTRYSRVRCHDSYGGFLFFDPETSKGGFSKLYGAIVDRMDRRDTPALTAFSCTPF